MRTLNLTLPSALIVVIAALSGMVNAIDIPTRQALLREIVGLEDLPQAVALNLSMLNAARIIGPAVGSGFILWVGEGGCFAVNGLSYAAVVLCLVRLKLLKAPPAAAQPLWQAIKEGFVFVRDAPPLRLTLLISATAGLFAMPYGSLLPVFADTVLKDGPATLGLPMSAAGAGAFAGALLMSFKRATGAQGTRIIIATVIFGLCVASFAFSGLMWLALGVMLITGFAQIVHTTAATINVQRHAPDCPARAGAGPVRHGPARGAALRCLAGRFSRRTDRRNGDSDPLRWFVCRDRRALFPDTAGVLTRCVFARKEWSEVWQDDHHVGQAPLSAGLKKAAFHPVRIPIAV